MKDRKVETPVDLLLRPGSNLIVVIDAQIIQFGLEYLADPLDLLEIISDAIGGGEQLRLLTGGISLVCTTCVFGWGGLWLVCCGLCVLRGLIVGQLRCGLYSCKSDRRVGRDIC